MPVHQLSELTWEEAGGLDRGRTVAVLPVGAVEAHGPHLPLGTDVVIAEAMAREGAARLATRGIGAVLLPPLSYTAAPFAARFPGTISLSPESVTALVLDLARELTRQGYAALAIANAHLDPAHIGALDAVTAQAAKEGLLPVVFPNLARKPWASRLGEEFRSGACHAGRFEGSVVLAERPDLVRNDTLAALPPNPASLSVAIREGKRSFEEAGGPRAYFGSPAEATAEEGRATIATLGSILEEAVQGAVSLRRDA